jgi:hypothetical protein
MGEDLIQSGFIERSGQVRNERAPGVMERERLSLVRSALPYALSLRRRCEGVEISIAGPRYPLPILGLSWSGPEYAIQPDA